jgi:3',5'-cyclic AMP phosphodiesterase CpdA
MGMSLDRGIVLAHVTDAHVAASGKATAILKHRSAEILADLVEQCVDLGVDAALFGGDNIDNRGSGAEDLELFLRLTAPLPSFFCTFGNHEAQWPRPGRITKADVAARLAGRGTDPELFCFAQTMGNVRVIGIDTTLVGSSGGYVSPGVMRFLHAELARAQEEHVVVLGHHLLHRAWEPYSLQAWDEEYLVANRAEVIALLASCPRVRAYLCGHHHASRIQRIACRGQSGGFYHVVSPSPAAFPCTARLLRFGEVGIEVEALRPRIVGLAEESREAVLDGRKARRFATLGAGRSFLEYVEGRAADNAAFLPYHGFVESRRDRTPERRAAATW